MLLVLLGLSGLIACNDEGVEFNNDGDGTELEGYDNVEMVGLQGGSGTEGNPAIVVMGFALDTVEFDKWSRHQLGHSPVCCWNTAKATPIPWNTARREASKASRWTGPNRRRSASTHRRTKPSPGIVLSSENNERTLRLDVTYNGNTVNVEIPEGIQFGLMEGITPWVGGNPRLFVVPAFECLGGAVGWKPGKRVHHGHRMADRAHLPFTQDTNRDAQLDDEEKSEGEPSRYQEQP